jgi:preprotein translocase subunit YajC
VVRIHGFKEDVVNQLAALLQLADGAAQQTQQSGPPNACGAAGGAQSLIFLLLMFVVFYFVLIRPQTKKQKEHQNMLGNLKSGDRVVTRGGVIGKITGIKDGVFTIEIQEKIRVQILKGYIEGMYQPQQHAADKSSDKATAKDTPSDAKT